MSSFNLCATQLRTPLHSLSTHKRFYFKFAFYNAEAIPKSLNAYFSAGVCEDLLRVGDFGPPRSKPSGMNIATNNAKITNTAPNAKGGPGIIV